MTSIARRPDGRWRARYSLADGRQVARHFDRKSDARRWLEETDFRQLPTDVAVGRPRGPTTVAQWCETWVDGYGTNRPRTVRQAKVHLAHIVDAFGDMPLSAVRPSHVRSWTAALQRAGFAPSYVYALHRRLSQVLADAVHDGLLERSPCSRRTSPRAGAQRPYVATTEQVWALHDAFPDHLKPALLLGAFVGLRTGEVCGLRVDDLDVARSTVTPTFQYPREPLKGDNHRTTLPIPASLTAELAVSIERWGSGYLVSDGHGRQISPRTIDRAMRLAREQVGMPDGFRFHDLRHYLASLLISRGLDVKVVQHRLRHASATTTLNIYAHLWPDSDESARAALGAVLSARAAGSRSPAPSPGPQDRTRGTTGIPRVAGVVSLPGSPESVAVRPPQPTSRPRKR